MKIAKHLKMATVPFLFFAKVKVC